MVTVTKPSTLLATKSALRAARRTYVAPANSSRSASSSSSSSNDDGYVSPFRRVFENIDKGTTFLGTTKPYRPPPAKYLKCGIPADAIRYQTKCYGRLFDAPFAMPDEHKVTLTVPKHALPLDEKEMMVLKEIVGNRLDQKALRLSSSQFGSRIENKRHAVSMLDRVVDSAKALAQRLET